LRDRPRDTAGQHDAPAHQHKEAREFHPILIPWDGANP
jgi:hypothetical protein